MATVEVKVVDLEATKTKTRFARMRGHASFLREQIELAEVFKRWAMGASDCEIDGMRRDLRIRQLRATELQAG